MNRLAWVMIGWAAIALFQSVRAQDPALVDAKHYRVELDNDQVRVLRARYGPGEKSVMHAHPNSLAIFLTDADVRFTFPDGSSQVSSNKAGTFLWTPATVHLPENIGNRPLEALVVELKTTTAIPAMPQREVSPAIKRRVDKELTVFAASLADRKTLQKPDLFGLLTECIKQDPDIYGAAFAFAPQISEGVVVKTAPYVYRHGDVFVEKDLIDNYDYTTPEQQWYAKPVAERKATWSRPYYDRGGCDAWIVSYSVPLFGGDHQLLGVVRSDVLLPIQ